MRNLCSPDSRERISFSSERRAFSRRADDSAVREAWKEQNRKVQSLLQVGHLIGLDLHLDSMLYRIAEKAAEIMDADRCSVFLYAPETDTLWSTVAIGMKGQTIRISAHEGIAGHCFQTGKTINLEEAYMDHRFNRSVDDQTGYRTRTLLCLPLYTRSKQVLGVIQVLNKKIGVFNQDDETLLKTFGNQVAVFLEMAQLQQARLEALEQSRRELVRLNLVKDKALDHLSHELRTPLSVIQGNLRVLRKKLEKQAENPVGESFFATFEKHLGRLLEIQRETDKIIRSHQALAETTSLKEAELILDRLAHGLKMPEEIVSHWQALTEWVKKHPAREASSWEEIPLLPFLEELLQTSKDRWNHRSITLESEVPLGLKVPMNADILKSVLIGLIKNAVENTPDEGTIRILAAREDPRVVLKIEDFGIGITEENQKSLFDGLFHTQETDLYTSKKPYDFYAGGKGLDLLQAKVYGQRFGFDLMVESRRCHHIPRDSDLCPGKISDCSFCRTLEDCLRSGGSVFSLSFLCDHSYSSGTSG